MLNKQVFITLPLNVPSKRIGIAFIFSALFFVILQSGFYAVLPSATSMIVTAEIDHDDTFQVYYWNGLRKPLFSKKYSHLSHKIKSQAKQNIFINMRKAPVRKTRLDVGHKPGVVKLYQISIYSHFAKAVTLLPKDILATFTPGKKDVTMELKDGFVEVVSKSNDPYLLAQRSLLSTNTLFYLVLSIIAALVLFVILLEFDFTGFAAFQDFKLKGPTTGTNIDALDGLRGIAAIMVVADHAYDRLDGIGNGGVWIFMALSGFLLARPFISEPSRALSAKYLGRFFVRRCQRIIPIYYVYITIVYLLMARFTEAVMHYLFLEARAHLWVIPQEAIFYLVLPVIMGINYIVLRGKIPLIVISLLLLAILANSFLTTSVFSLYGMFQQDLRLYIGVFISGILSSYIYYGLYQPSNLRKSAQPWIDRVFSILSLALLALFIFGSTGIMWGGTRIFALIYFQWFGVAAGLLIFAIVASGGNSTIVKALSWNPLRAFSIVTLSVYLFHPLVIAVLRKGSHYFLGYEIYGFTLIFFTLIVSYFVACLTYTYIEKPLQGR